MQTQKKIRIGELAHELGVEKFVIRFWEKEFNIKPQRSDGQQRFYHEEDVTLLKTVKSLLYEQGFTIAGAKKHLANTTEVKTIQPGSKTTLEEKELATLCPTTQKQQLTKQMLTIKQQLIKLKELLQ